MDRACRRLVLLPGRACVGLVGDSLANTETLVHPEQAVGPLVDGRELVLDGREGNDLRSVNVVGAAVMGDGGGPAGARS